MGKEKHKPNEATYLDEYTDMEGKTRKGYSDGRWVKVFEDLLIDNEARAEKFEQGLIHLYKTSQKEIEKEIESFYLKYAKENKISLLEAKKLLTTDELKSFHNARLDYINEVKRLGENAFTDEYKKYLKRLSGIAYISRLEELTINIERIIKQLEATYINKFSKLLASTYEHAYYRSMYEVQQGLKFGISFTTPGIKQVEYAVKRGWIGQNYIERINAGTDRMTMNLKTMLAQEFVRGRSPRQVSKELSEKVGISYRAAQKLVRTEMNHISNEATMKAYKDSGVVRRFQYVSTLDSRTSPICRHFDGKIFSIKEGEAGVNIPPLHPYCRSTTIPYFEADEISTTMDRVARTSDGEGKSYKLGEDVTFFEWVNKYGSESFKKQIEEEQKEYDKFF